MKQNDDKSSAAVQNEQQDSGGAGKSPLHATRKYAKRAKNSGSAKMLKMKDSDKDSSKSKKPKKTSKKKRIYTKRSAFWDGVGEKGSKLHESRTLAAKNRKKPKKAGKTAKATPTKKGSRGPYKKRGKTKAAPQFVNENFTVVKNVPIPEVLRNKLSKYPFHKLKVGHSFDFKPAYSKTISVAMSNFAKKSEKAGKKVKFGMATDPENPRRMRVWRLL